MAKESQGKRAGSLDANHGKQATGGAETARGSNRDSGVWIREDGAICFGEGECVVMSSRTDGEVDFEINPSACGRETGKIVLDYLLTNIANRKPINIRLKPEDK
jgi:hypothetical protein